MRGTSVHSTLDDPTDTDWGRRDQRAVAIGATRDLRGILAILRWRASLIAVVTVTMVIAAAAATVIVPAKYKATTIVLVDPRQQRVTNSEAVISGIGSDAAAVESQVELIESSSLARKVVARLNLDQDPEFAAASLLERLTEAVLPAGPESQRLAERRISSLVSKFQKNLSVRRRGLTYVLEISFSSTDAAKAAHISGAVADAYLDDQRQAKADITARASGWLGDRIEEMRERVRASERAVADYKSSKSIVDVTQGNRLVSRQIEDLTQQLALTRTRTADARARLERMQQAAKQNGDPAALSESLQSPVIANLRSQYAEAARVDAEYNALYGAKYPGLVAVRAQLADLRRQIDGEIARILAGIRNEHQVATAREASLEAELTKLKAQAATFNEANVKLGELEREAQANRSLFEQFLSRAKETTEQQSLQIADARIVSPALVPLKPDRPATPLLLLAAAACGLILGIGAAFMLEQTRRGFRTPGEVEQLLALPTFGVFPLRPKRATIARQEVALVPARRDGAADPVACFEANLHAVRARLAQVEPRHDGEVLVVVSALPGEGKSTFACNFALASATAGARTLLIDGDIYTRSVTRAFGLSGPGLCEIVHGQSSLPQAMKKEPRSGLHILGVGAGVGSRASRGLDDIDGPGLEALLRGCRGQFDLVLIDSPAILSMAGLAPFMARADRAVMVVEWDRTDRQAVAEALDILGPDAWKVAGIVLNKVAPGWYRMSDDGRYAAYFNDTLEARGAA